MIEASLILLGLVLLKAGLEDLWWHIQCRYAERRIEGRKIMTKLDGPILLMLVMLTGCAIPKCKPLHPYNIGGMTIYPVVCPAERMDTVCRHDDPDTRVAACAWRKGSKCWIMASDTQEGSEAIFHEHAHCAGGDENTARCDDWPGTEGAPVDQFCDKAWPRGL